MLQAGVHFCFFHELTAVGLRHTIPHGRPKSGIFLNQTQDGSSYQPLGVGACLGGDLCELLFLFGCEMYFHCLQGTREAGSRNREGTHVAP